MFEILSNAIDEAREGYGDLIVVTRYEDLSVDVEDFGRGLSVDWNEKEKRYNWELVFCEMYAGGKYDAGGATMNFLWASMALAPVPPSMLPSISTPSSAGMGTNTASILKRAGMWAA